MEQVIVEHFGKPMKSKSKSNALGLHVLVVDQALKPGIVLEYSEDVVKKFPPFLKAIFHKKLVKNMLCVICIGHTSILANPVSLLAVPDSQNAMGGSLLFIDASKHLSEPRLVDNTEGVADTLDVYLALCKCCQGRWKVEVHDDGSFNPCTLFGLLLGYPVVYWFQSMPVQPKSSASGVKSGDWVEVPKNENEVMLMRNGNDKVGVLPEVENSGSFFNEYSCDNCLSWKPLQAYQVVAKASTSSLHGGSKGPESDRECVYVTYPFSCPQSLLGDLSEHISAWFEKISLRASKTQIFSNLELQSHVEEHDYVCL